MGLAPFERGRGDVSLRVVEPVGFDQTDDAAMVLGSDEPGWMENLAEGDSVSVWRNLDVTGVDLLRARFRTRGPSAPPSPYVWFLELLIDDVVFLSRSVRSGHTEDLFDVGVNVSKIGGTHKFEVRLRMVTP